MSVAASAQAAGENPSDARVAPAKQSSWLRRHRVFLTWLTMVLLAVLTVRVAGEVRHYQPLRLGSDTIDLDVKTIGDGIEQTRLVFPYEAGRSFSYATSVENVGSHPVVLTGAVVETNPPGARPQVSLPGPDGRPSACGIQICLASAGWAYGQFGDPAGQYIDLTQGKFDYFGQHTQFQPFRLPLTIKPLSAAQQHLPAACPKRLS